MSNKNEGLTCWRMLEKVSRSVDGSSFRTDLPATSDAVGTNGLLLKRSIRSLVTPGDGSVVVFSPVSVLNLVPGAGLDLFARLGHAKLSGQLVPNRVLKARGRGHDPGHGLGWLGLLLRRGEMKRGGIISL